MAAVTASFVYISDNGDKEGSQNIYIYFNVPASFMS